MNDEFSSQSGSDTEYRSQDVTMFTPQNISNVKFWHIFLSALGTSYEFATSNYIVLNILMYKIFNLAPDWQLWC